MLHLVNSTIFWLYTHAGVNSTFTTGGEIRKTVCHIDPQRVYVHTREQLAKWLIGGYLHFRLLNKPLTWNIAIYRYGIEPMMSEDRGYQFIFYWASHCKSPWWHWSRVLALFWRSRSDWQVKSHPRQKFCSSGYQVTSVMFLINRLHNNMSTLFLYTYTIAMFGSHGLCISLQCDSTIKSQSNTATSRHQFNMITSSV